MEPHFLAQTFPSDCYLGLLGLQLEIPSWLPAGEHRLQQCQGSALPFWLQKWLKYLSLLLPSGYQITFIFSYSIFYKYNGHRYFLLK